MANASKEKPAEKIISRIKGLKAADLKGLFTGWRRSIKSKLLVWLLLISLVPLAIIALFSYRYSATALQRQSFENLESTLAFQKQALQQYFTEQEKTLRNISETMHLLQQETFIKLAAVRDLQKKEITSYFNMRFQNAQAFGSNPEQKKMFAGLVKDAAAGLDSDFATYLTNWLAQRDFFSLILLSADGKVLFSTDTEVERDAAVQENTPEWRALQKGMQETSFIDYARSSFNAEKIVSYFSTPFTLEGQLAGVFLFRLKDEALDGIIKNTPGLGGNGEAYIVGADGMFRSNSVYFEEPTLANPAFVVDTESVVYALAGESGEQTTVNYRGDYVLSSYTSVSVHGTTWVLIVESDQSDAMAPKRQAGEKETDHLRDLAATYGFPDLYLLNPDGYIFYSATEGKDHFTNILTGPYAKSGFAGTVRGALEKKVLKVSDYSFYEAIGNKPAAFMTMPIMNNEGNVMMLVALQIPVDQINAVMNIHSQFEQGSGHKHEGHDEGIPINTYLVGQDKLWRSEATDAKKFGVNTTLLKAKADTEAVKDALAGNAATKIVVNSANEKVLSSWAQFNYNNKDIVWAIISEANYDEVHKPVTSLLRIIGLTALIAAVLIVVVSLLVASGITRQVGAIVKVMAKVEKGDYSEQVPVTSKDELGRLASDFNTMTGTIQNLIQTRQEEHDKLNTSIIRLLEEITVLADGDLTIRATVTDDVIGTLADSLNLMLENLGRAFRRIKDSALQVGSTANVLSSSTGELAAQNDSQSKMLNAAVEKIILLTEEIKKAAEKADQSAGTSKISSHVAEDGAAAVRETSQSMEAIRGNVQNTARAIKRLGESSQEISDFARTINEISDRTSILALNASIQAAAAGEEGRGFAVVAEEIQRLAERAATSTRQIETLIRNILGEITEAGVSMDASIQEVVQGTKLSQNALAKLEEITAHSNEVAELIEGVAAVSKEQAETTAQLAGKMKELGGISLETAQETMGASISMREMAAMGDDMLHAIAVFKLEGDSKKA
ncbi:methyl-accepting chemotaxis protein [Candidatus Electronema sp. PJ]|uniref:methyl-accepting chemotaxis protein n=1 Tax=Candidatus Electronema sp. PJ TaxID=3401572 RepID=UPI003AA84CE3